MEHLSSVIQTTPCAVTTHEPIEIGPSDADFSSTMGLPSTTFGLHSIRSVHITARPPVERVHSTSARPLGQDVSGRPLTALQAKFVQHVPE